MSPFQVIAYEVWYSCSFVEVGKVKPDFDFGVKCMPDRVWPSNKNDRADCGTIPGPICRPARASLSVSSNVSCIKLFEKQPSAIEDGSSIRDALYPFVISDFDKLFILLLVFLYTVHC